MTESESILVTGANGFVGSQLIDQLRSRGFTNVIGAYRQKDQVMLGPSVVVGSVDATTDWTNALRQSVGVVIHTAARVHIMADQSSDPLAEYRKVNVDGTLNLARQAAENGASRFVFISSIKVNGERTAFNQPFKPEDLPAPQDAYGISKLEAEQGLMRIARETGMDVVIIRPTLVYGPGVKGNFATMVRMVDKGWPLPFGSIHNKRSLVALDNLIDLIMVCVEHPAAANEVFLAADGEDLSTTELLQQVALCLGKTSRLIPLPEALLRLCAKCVGKTAMADRLLDSLQVDISKSKVLLCWKPPLTVEAGLRNCLLGKLVNE